MGMVLPAVILDDDKDGHDTYEARRDFNKYLIIQNIIVTVCCTPMLFFAQAKPPTPPSAAASKEEVKS